MVQIRLVNVEYKLKNYIIMFFHVFFSQVGIEKEALAQDIEDPAAYRSV